MPYLPKNTPILPPIHTLFPSPALYFILPMPPKATLRQQKPTTKPSHKKAPSQPTPLPPSQALKCAPRPISRKMNADAVKAILGPYKASNLTLVQARFVAEYVSNGLDPVLAYRNAVDLRAGPQACRNAAYKLLSLPEIKAAVTGFMENWLGEKRMKLEREIIQSLYNQAFYDPAMFMSPDGSPKFTSWEEIPLEWRCCVKTIKTEFYGKGAERAQTTITLCDRNWAQEKLSRYVALFRPEAVGGVQHVTNNVIVGRISEDAGARLAAVFAEVSNPGNLPRNTPVPQIPSIMPDKDPRIEEAA